MSASSNTSILPTTHPLQNPQREMGINLWITTLWGGEVAVHEPSTRGSGGGSSTGTHPAVDDGVHLSHPSAMRSTCMILGSTPTEPAPRAAPRDALDGMRLEHGRADDRPPETASRRNGRHPRRIHRNLERPGGAAFPNFPRPSPDVMTKGRFRGRPQGPRPCRRSAASAAPGASGIVVGPASPPAAQKPPATRPPSAAHPRRPHRAEPFHDAERPSVITRRGAGANPGGAGAGPDGAGSSGRRHADPALRSSGTGRRGVPQGRGRRGSCRRRRAGARGRSRRGRVPGARRGRCR